MAVVDGVRWPALAHEPASMALSHACDEPRRALGPPIHTEPRIQHPGRLVIAGFAALITLGSILLTLPVAHEPGAALLDFGEAFFTACSAVTVTGLSVVDTGSTFSVFGEIVILVLIQIGGLGIMTLGSIAGVVLSRRLGVRRGELASAEIGVGHLGELRPVIRAIALFTLAWETLAFVVLTIAFRLDGEHDLLQAMYLSIFHAVSAFNNAGFSVFSDGLRGYVTYPGVNLVVIATIIAGGVGFPVIVDIARRRQSGEQGHRWSLHTRVTVAATVALLLLGTFGLLLMEWQNPQTLGGLSIPQKVLAALFQSTTTRTAGFDTIPIGALYGGSHLLMILLMVIGAGSASTSGGIKVTTFAVVVRTAMAEFRNNPDVTLFDRRISISAQRQALALVVAALGTVGTVTFLLSSLNPELLVESVLFEAASAFGTVGLSVGITSSLDSVSRVLVIALMFIGRVGPITFGSALLFRQSREQFHYPTEDVIIG